MNDKATPKTDKLDEVFPVRIPTCLKSFLDNLPDEFKQPMLRDIRERIALAVHMSKFEPSLYLSSEESKDT